MSRLNITTDHRHVRLAGAGQLHKLYWLRYSFNIMSTRIMNILQTTLSIMPYKSLSFFPRFPDGVFVSRPAPSLGYGARGGPRRSNGMRVAMMCEERWHTRADGMQGGRRDLLEVQRQGGPRRNHGSQGRPTRRRNDGAVQNQTVCTPGYAIE
jgi:hypothetical protein